MTGSRMTPAWHPEVGCRGSRCTGLSVGGGSIDVMTSRGNNPFTGSSPTSLPRPRDYPEPPPRPRDEWPRGDRSRACRHCGGRTDKGSLILREGSDQPGDVSVEQIFCSGRCLGAHALHLSGEDGKDLAALQDKLDESRHEIKRLERMIKYASEDLHNGILDAFIELMRLAPGLESGKVQVQPAGGQVRDAVKRLRHAINRQIVDPRDLYR